MGKKKAPEGDFGPPISFDPNFNGPIHRRGCTDIICLVVFVAFIVCWGFICGYAFISGDVSRYLSPVDSDGNRCGFSNNVKDKPYLVFFDFSRCLDPVVPITGCKTTKLCVKECPKQTIYWDKLTESEFNDQKNELLCVPSVNINDVTYSNLKEYINRGECARISFKSTAVVKICKPDEEGYLQNKIPDFDAMPLMSRTAIVTEWQERSNAVIRENKMGARIIADLNNLKWWLLLALFVVMIVCMIYIGIMRWIAGPVVWFSLLAIVALLSWSIYLCYMNYDYYRNEIKEPDDISITGALESIFTQKETWMVLMILTIITLLIIVLMIIFLRKRIVIAIALVKEGSKAVSSIKSTFFFPVIPWILQILVLALAISASIYLTTIGDDTFQIRTDRSKPCTSYHGKRCNITDFSDIVECPSAECIYTGVTVFPIVPWMQAWSWIAFFWVMFFIQGLGDMILAGTFATWYWTFHKKDVPFFTLTKSASRAICYNMGTVAFGSLIVAICRLIRVVIEYVDAQCKKYDNFFVKCLLCFCRCFFACLESFLRFINKNAYIMCAVHGKNFCASARDAFSLLMRNILRVAVLDKVTDFLFFISKLGIAIGCGTAAYYIFKEPVVTDAANLDEMNYNLVPAIIIGVIAYFVASVFFGVYSMAVDTLFLCFLEDLERNDGSAERPYFMSKNLMKILGKKNK